ncbi:MAG: RNA 2',3'-cyclic phosphodiesterase [Actinobacteria bacterium]|nr:RNA 2',3'-cyclic phosphodiesterase [Actinomycetota bacterium]MCG2802294.1 RNA 2',3'-cyclic phosphodiesterase [Cellulomonas sp.]
MRLFVAVTPPAAALDHLDLALAAVRRGPAGRDDVVRWSARETWHVTAAFFGEVPDGRVPALVDQLGAVAASTAPYDLELRGAGLFAHRTLWVGLGGDGGRQRGLATAVAGAGEALGLEADGRARERAHLTVGRVRVGSRPAGRGSGAGRGGSGPGLAGRPTGGVDALVGALSVYVGPLWRVGEITLQRSEPGAGRGGGPRYTVLHRAELVG